MYEVLIICYIVVAVVLIGFILLQQGKGADAGASFGGGASGTVFGSAGSGNFLSRTTAVLAVLFFVISLVIGGLNNHSSEQTGAFNNLSQTAQQVEQQQLSAKEAAALKAKQEAQQKTNDIPQ